MYVLARPCDGQERIQNCGKVGLSLAIGNSRAKLDLIGEIISFVQQINGFAYFHSQKNEKVGYIDIKIE